MKVTADNLKSAILSRIREVCERKAEAYIEPVHALVIRDDLYLSVCCACTFDEYRALMDELAGTDNGSPDGHGHGSAAEYRR